jgi:hypothetical protein
VKAFVSKVMVFDKPEESWCRANTSVGPAGHRLLPQLPLAVLVIPPPQ